MLVNESQVFNLMNTNGRREDVVNAMQVYLQILDEIQQESREIKWERFPVGLSQYKFYAKAVEYCSDVFKKHNDYDQFVEMLEIRKTKESFNNLDVVKLIASLGPKYEKFIDILDKSIEARSRHYTSTLVKLGLVDKDRRITNVGNSILANKQVERDDFEKILPIDNINLLYLRQLLKLKIIAKENKRSFYSPMIMAMYLLLYYDNVSVEDFRNIVQLQTPYHPISNVDNMINDYLSGKINIVTNKRIPELFYSNDIIDELNFKKYFYNSKQKTSVDVYYEFYNRIFEFNNNPNEFTFNEMLEYYRSNKEMLNKAFGYGKSLFILNSKVKTVEDFFEENKLDIFCESLNEKLYTRFLISKKVDSVKEYSDTTIRLMKVTGIIKFKNGIVELAYKDIFKELLKNVGLKDYIFGELDDKTIDEYEGNYNSYMSRHVKITTIFNINHMLLNKVMNLLNRKYHSVDSKDLQVILSSQKQMEFIQHLEEKYPKEKILEILKLVSDRRNDSRIKAMVNPSATVPTIYEYIVAIAWYYFSGKDFDVLNSMNLSLNADYEPETHAGGGAGDIVIEYTDRVVMLEVTLMNKQAQKRGEWEPVLRHSINLKIEKEPKEVMTFFIADELDLNTTNIWRAVSSVPLQATNGSSKVTDNVVIMPLENKELISLIENGKNARALEVSTRVSFDMVKKQFDPNWKNKIFEVI
ncbi:AlwI family type II restriction endonuclease [[Clostridium] innocuum]|nr:AlwI family type II restriction endonuclease [[Clostridium] innocuum]MCR0167936.1 AlwI family type II restriction endonuclease [[Clostridium] innocuum]MCR0189632.1 AlwI family type II restriction endonuclease [[Clostridium] innocuum]MCR0354805.1 AlwI family type II restriction endonuclease [[Clostridium] innocuum]MCR0398190.1 AlwI family type II restriction endonuclease [[Clostridium] innocuum]